MIKSAGDGTTPAERPELDEVDRRVRGILLTAAVAAYPIRPHDDYGPDDEEAGGEEA